MWFSSTPVLAKMGVSDFTATYCMPLKPIEMQLPDDLQ
jgi:hypothetical protein